MQTVLAIVLGLIFGAAESSLLIFGVRRLSGGRLTVWPFIVQFLCPLAGLLLCAFVNVLTNPVVVLLYLLFPHPAATAVWECTAAAVEGWHYHRYGQNIRAPWLFSALCNGISFSLGLVINRFL